MSVEIYIDDLKPDIQRQVLEELGLETAEDGNYDIIPLFSVERPELDFGQINKFLVEGGWSNTPSFLHSL